MTAAHPAWQDVGVPGPRPSLAPVPRGTTADLVVVGLGASGLAACRQAARRGVDVVGLDAVGVAAGAAGANGGFLLAGLADFHHDAVARWGRDRAARAYAWTRGLIDAEAAEDPHLRRVGSLRLAADTAERDDVAAQLAALRADGFPAERWEGPEGVGLLVPDDAAIHPVARCRRLAGDAIAAGARLHAPARATRVGADGVDLDDGTSVAARHVLVAVDGGLERLVPVPGVRTARLQMLATAPTEPRVARPEYRRWGYDYVQQLPTGEVLLGGGRDVEDGAEWGAPREPTPAVQAHLDGELARLGVDAPVTHRWAAHAAWTDDHLPVAARLDGVHVVGGHSGHGNLLGPALAVLAVDDALDDSSPGDRAVPWPARV